MSFQAEQTEWARVLVESLAGAGVTDVVVSPGSRSTPFVLQVLAERRLRVHDVIDERSAAFFALGQARMNGRPSGLIATSGTAGAHYLPAAIEAGLSHLPLLMITADRPAELQACGALQTVDQLKLFGDHARAFYEVGIAQSDPGALRGLERTVAQAVFRSMHPLPGAVHLNVKARKPLESESLDADGALGGSGPPRKPSVRAVRPRLVPPAETIAEISELCAKKRRGLIVLGPGPLAQLQDRRSVLALAERTGYPILAEATSQLRFLGSIDDTGPVLCDAFDPLLHSAAFRRAHEPELILQLGPTPTSSGWARYVAEHRDVERIVIAPFGWNDPDGSALLMIAAELGETVRLLVEGLHARGVEPSPWPDRFAQANRAALALIDREVGLAAEDGALSEGSIARRVVERAPRGSLLALANGLAIRHADTFCPGCSNDLAVLSQRGASGIDGFISGAAGAASVADRTVTVLVGDVGLLHDLGGLGLAARAKVPLVLVVIHNDGGRIFEQLPLANAGGLADDALAHWLTPHGRSFGRRLRCSGCRTRSPARLARSFERSTPPTFAVAQR